MQTLIVTDSPAMELTDDLTALVRAETEGGG
jgi:hypothetical protein